MKIKLINCVKIVLFFFMLGVLFVCCQGVVFFGNVGKNVFWVRIVFNDFVKLVFDKVLNDVFCVFVGLLVDKVSGKFYVLIWIKEWKNYVCYMDQIWNVFWQMVFWLVVFLQMELEDINICCYILFYFFGGFDFLFVNVFFFEMDIYVLIGLEFVGIVLKVKYFFVEIYWLYQNVVLNVFNLSFFNDMDKELVNDIIDGVVFIYLLLMVWGNCKIVSIQEVWLLEIGDFFERKEGDIIWNICSVGMEVWFFCLGVF